jgi:hypothetical protein
LVEPVFQRYVTPLPIAVSVTAEPGQKVLLDELIPTEDVGITLMVIALLLEHPVSVLLTTTLYEVVDTGATA